MAAQFQECREKIVELPNIVRDLCRVLYYGKVRAGPPWFGRVGLLLMRVGTEREGAGPHWIMVKTGKAQQVRKETY